MSPELKAKFTMCAFIVQWLIHHKKAKDDKIYNIEVIKEKNWEKFKKKGTSEFE